MGVIEIIAIIGSFLGSVVGLLTYFERRERKREQRAKKQEQERLEKITSEIMKKIIPMWQNEFKTQIDELVSTNEFAALEDQVKNQGKMLIDFEKSRLKAEIMDFGEDLKNGIEKSSVAFQHIHEVFSKYKKLGGNSYVLGVFEYIVSKQREQNDRKK